jgi:hypothetical protein
MAYYEKKEICKAKFLRAPRAAQAEKWENIPLLPFFCSVNE